jgi:hypothetical protein
VHSLSAALTVLSAFRDADAAKRLFRKVLSDQSHPGDHLSAASVLGSIGYAPFDLTGIEWFLECRHQLAHFVVGVFFSAGGLHRLSVDASRNGGVTVKGWLRNEVLVRARVEASADNEGAAANLASRVSVDSSGGQVRATGPESIDNNNSWWSVSYEIFIPQNTDLTTTARNGGITISDVRGQIRFAGRNGGVHLKRLAGDVSGSTGNGGVQVELTGTI